LDLIGAMEALSDAMIAADRSDHIVAINAGVTSLLGWSPEALVGRSLRAILPVSFAEVEDHARDMLGAPIPLPARRADGSEVDVEVVLSRVRADEGPLLVLTLRDVSARVALERWSDIDRSLLAQYEVMTMLARGGDLASVAREILRALSVTLGWEVGLYWEPDEAANALVLKQWWQSDDTFAPFLEALAEQPLAAGEGLAGEAWTARWLTTWRHENHASPPLDVGAHIGTRAALAIPVVWGRRVHAVLAFLTTRARPVGEKPLQAMSMTGLQIGQFMERLDVEAESKARDQWLSTTLRSIGDAVIATDLEGRLAFMNPVAEALTGWEGAQVQGERLDSVLRLLHPTTRAPLALPTLKELEGGEAGASSKHVVLQSRDGSERLIEHVAAPIRTVDGEPQGAVVVFRDTTEKVQTEAELARLLTAEQLARASADFQRELAAFLDEATTALGRSLDARTTFEELAGILVPRLSDICAIHTVRKPEEAAQAQLMRGRDRERTRRLSEAIEAAGAGHLSFGIPGIFEASDSGPYVVEAPRALIEDRVTDPGLLAALRACDLSSLICLPLRARGVVLGWMTLATSGPDRRFRSRDLELFVELSNRAGQALDNVRLYRDAQEAIRVRDDFLSIASHELRTPLTPLQLQLQALMRAIRTRTPPPPPEQIGQKLEIISRQVVRLERLVTSLLDISRITGRRLVLEPETIDLAEVIGDIIQRSEEHARQQGIALRFSSEGPVVGQWDRLRIDQVVSNLLSNAIKFGAGQPVTVELATDAQTARIRVVDRGIGIPPSDQSRIFERFERAVAMRHFGGFGLGLWIVRQLVEAMGGSVRVQSVAGEGSTFEVVLPLTPPEAATGENDPGNDPGS